MVSQEDTVKVVKFAARTLAGIGASRLASDAIRANTADPVSTFDKVVRYTGAFAIGGLASKAAGNYVNAEIDQVVEMINKVRASKKTETTSDQ